MDNMSDKTPLYEQLDVASCIVTVRGQKVILDADLARIYGVTTKALNQAVKRNADRFPADFAFQLTPGEFAGLRSQFATSGDAMRSQFVTTSDRRRLTSPPRAFTEHGAIMAANVLSSPQAIEMGVFVVRAFVKLREQFLNRAELEARLNKIERDLSGHDAALRELYRQLRPLLLPPQDPPRKRIGFSVKERRASYETRKSR